MLALGGTRFQDGVVNADVLTLGIKFRILVFKVFRAPGSGDPLQVGRGFGKMFAQSIGQRARAPDKDSAVPIIVSRSQELVRLLLVGLFRKTLHAEQLRIELVTGLNVS